MNGRKHFSVRWLFGLYYLIVTWLMHVFCLSYSFLFHTNGILMSDLWCYDHWKQTSFSFLKSTWNWRCDSLPYCDIYPSETASGMWKKKVGRDLISSLGFDWIIGSSPFAVSCGWYLVPTSAETHVMQRTDIVNVFDKILQVHGNFKTMMCTNKLFLINCNILKKKIRFDLMLTLIINNTIC